MEIWSKCGSHIESKLINLQYLDLVFGLLLITKVRIWNKTFVTMMRKILEKRCKS